MIVKLLISLLAGVFLIYCLFCMFLTCVALPSENNYRCKFHFQEEPTGFIKYSRIFGNIMIYTFIVFLITGIMYIILFANELER